MNTMITEEVMDEAIKQVMVDFDRLERLHQEYEKVQAKLNQIREEYNEASVKVNEQIAKAQQILIDKLLEEC